MHGLNHFFKLVDSSVFIPENGMLMSGLKSFLALSYKIIVQLIVTRFLMSQLSLLLGKC